MKNKRRKTVGEVDDAVAKRLNSSLFPHLPAAAYLLSYF